MREASGKVWTITAVNGQRPTHNLCHILGLSVILCSLSALSRQLAPETSIVIRDQMEEIGFWDYTCPLNGSLERYTTSDWDVLLDDMVAGGFNSLVLCVKWLTTGYRSHFPWLDQDPTCSAIATDNSIVHYALQGARQRGIHTWLLVVASIFETKAFGLPGAVDYWPGGYSAYDLDCPGLAERMDLLFSEVVDLFGHETEGMVVELEFCDGEAPHRIPIYNEWSRLNNRPDFEAIKAIRLEPRQFPFQHWRDFTTSRRIETLKHIELVLKQHGFTGNLASIIEIDNQPAAVLGNVNLEMLHAALPHWSVVTYDSIYDRRRNRLATMDFCIHQPRLAGLEVNYLTRGVMTFHIPPELGATTLQEQWRLELEDAAQHRPDRLWFMGADCRTAGLVCNDQELAGWGFPDGRSARLHLLKSAQHLSA